MTAQSSHQRLKNFAKTMAFIIIAVIALAEFLLNPEINPVPAQPPNPLPQIEITKAAPPSGEDFPAWLAVYFTNPNPPDQLETGIDQTVLPFIEGAEMSIDATSFDLNLPSLVNALASAAKRGVKVRVVYDGENGVSDLNNAATYNKNFSATKILRAAKTKIVDGGRSNGLMHDKIMIVDGKTLFTGSWNLSYNDTYRNNNNLLKITSPELIANYQAKFDEMFVTKQFGTHAETQALQPELLIDGDRVENYFSPADEVMERLIGVVRSAKKSVHFMIFTYTDQELAAAMIDRKKAKVDVQGVIETRSAYQGALVQLYCAKLPVKVDGNKYTLHHKVIIVDGETVITGSFNFTKAANDANDENVLVIHNAAVAAAYEEEFQKMMSKAQEPDPEEILCE